jgi:hypothetical protein
MQQARHRKMTQGLLDLKRRTRLTDYTSAHPGACSDQLAVVLEPIA